MKFDRANSLARDTPAAVLAEAWGAREDAVLSVKNGKRPMTIREAGALAELHGLKLLDVLAV